LEGRPSRADVFRGWAALILFLLVASAAWVETDAYRLAAIALAIWGIVAYVRADDKPADCWMAYVCAAWVGFVALRYVGVYLSDPHRSFGTSEGIYLLPILYSSVGYMMFRYRRVLGVVVALFIVLSFAFAAATVDFVTVFDGSVHDFFDTNNTIHSSIGGGLVILAAINFAAYAGRTGRNGWVVLLFEFLAYATIVLCFVGLYGAKSKGVWTALAIAVGVQAFLFIRHGSGRRTLAACAALAVAFAGFLWVYGPDLWRTIGPTYDSLAALVLRAAETGRPLTAFREAIASGDAPINTNIRLMLWHNAFQVWANNPLLGSGIDWLDQFRSATYKDVGFNVVHNGYLEIAMRYGFVGLAFYATLYAWSVVMAYRAAVRGLLPGEAVRFQLVALVFFAVTILTNSNNRLAIGESLMLVAAAFGFHCFFLCQEADRKRGATAAAI
jgi:hypothetical protein